MFSFRNVSLVKQLSFFFVFVFLVPSIAIGSFLFLGVKNSLEQNKTELNYLASIHVGRVQSVLREYSAQQKEIKSDQKLLDELSVLQKNFESLSKTGQLRFFTVDTSGNIELISPSRFSKISSRASVQSLPFLIRSVLRTDHQFTDPVIDDHGHKVFLNIRYFKDKRFGYLMQKDLAEILSPLTGFRDIFLSALGLVAMIFLLLFFFAKQFVTDPLLNITEVAKRIEKGDYRKTPFVFGHNEVGTLSHAFDKMTNELIEANATLDAKVKEKTQQLEKALQVVQAQKQQDDAILSSIAEGMIATDHSGHVILMNRAAEEMLGIRALSATGESIERVLSLQKNNAERVGSVEHPGVAALRAQEKIRTTDLLAVCGEKVFPVEISAAPIFLNNRVIGSILIVTDITREKEIDRMKTEFIGIASHQLRGPLASLKWYGDWIAKGKAGKLVKMQKECMEKINASTANMISLVDDFLNVSRIEQGTLKNEPVAVCVKELVQNILSISEPEIIEKQLSVSLDDQSNNASLMVDPDMIREIVSNFISNAIKYTPKKGFVTVHLASDESQFHIHVENSGDGIPTSDQSKIFSKFYRASNMIKQGINGTGLGLYTTKRLAESMGGEVGFESREGESTTFWVKLPMG